MEGRRWRWAQQASQRAGARKEGKTTENRIPGYLPWRLESPNSCCLIAPRTHIATPRSAPMNIPPMPMGSDLASRSGGGRHRGVRTVGRDGRPRKRLDAVGVWWNRLGGCVWRGRCATCCWTSGLFLDSPHRICGAFWRCALAPCCLMRQRHFEPTERAMLLPDAIGLGLFAAVAWTLPPPLACRPSSA